MNLLKKVIETFKKYKSSSSLSDLNKFTNQLRFTSPHVRDASDINTALNELFDKFVVIDKTFHGFFNFIDIFFTKYGHAFTSTS